MFFIVQIVLFVNTKISKGCLIHYDMKCCIRKRDLEITLSGRKLRDERVQSRFFRM
jgi:hypothetical protein